MVGDVAVPGAPARAAVLPVVLNPIPFPSKWHILFGEPIPTAQHGPESIEDRQLVLELSELTRQTVQAMLLDGLARRRTAFF